MPTRWPGSPVSWTMPAASQLKELEETLVESAPTSTVEAFEREVRDLGRILAGDDGVGRHDRLRRQRSLRRWVDRNTGMCHTHLQLDPEADARVSGALDAAIAAEQAKPDDEQRTFRPVESRRHRRVDHRRPQRRPADTRSDGVGRLGHPAATACTMAGSVRPVTANRIPPDTVRRLCCEAMILPIVLNGAGETLDLGREQRLANRAQRRALRAMYRTCGYPGCTVRFGDCEIHHVIDWHPHGPTDLANLLPAVQASSSSGARRWLDAHPPPRPHHHPASSRRHPAFRRLHRRCRPHRPPQHRSRHHRTRPQPSPSPRPTRPSTSRLSSPFSEVPSARCGCRTGRRHRSDRSHPTARRRRRDSLRPGAGPRARADPRRSTPGGPWSRDESRRRRRDAP